jgi:hypothetical protein
MALEFRRGFDGPADHLVVRRVFARFDRSYPEGGHVIDPARLGLASILAVQSNTGYPVQWDGVNNRLKVFKPSGGSTATQATLTTAMAGDDNDITFQAIEQWAGDAGNGITVEFIDPDTEGALSVEVNGLAIVVTTTQGRTSSAPLRKSSRRSLLRPTIS